MVNTFVTDEATARALLEARADADIGIDLGTSGIKAVLIEDADARRRRGRASRWPSSIPQVGWSEQDADLWVAAVLTCLDRLAAQAPREMAAVEGIGLSGQMLAALLLDADLRPLRPAMLWNDQRAHCRMRRVAGRRAPTSGGAPTARPIPGSPRRS